MYGTVMEIGKPYPCHKGPQTAAGAELLLFKRSPWAAQPIPQQGAKSLNGPMDLSLVGFFAADRDELTCSAESGEPQLAAVSVEGGRLRIEPNGAGESGRVTITVTATDSDGVSAAQRFTLEVSPPRRPFGRGWRLDWLAGAERLAAEDAPAGGE